jgi:SAM-dependent methyltransferase
MPPDSRSLAHRRLSREHMDDPSADPADLRASLSFIRRVNTFLGYNRSTLRHLGRFSRRWKPGQTVRILDVATGSADLPRALLRWGGRRGFNVRVAAADLHPTTLRVAAELTPPDLRERLHFVRADALRLPFADGSFDYAVTSMFLHHLDDDSAAVALREMARVARRGIIAADLLRNRRAYAWITLLTLPARPMVRHDARVSVAQAFTPGEVIRLRDRAGLDFATVHRHFGHRFVLAGER